MKTLEELKLTTKDFDLMIEALDHLPNKGVASDLIFGILGRMVAETDEQEAEIKKAEDQKKRKEEQEKILLKDQINILKGKLSLLKQMLIEKNIIDKVDEGLKL